LPVARTSAARPSRSACERAAKNERECEREAAGKFGEDPRKGAGLTVDRASHTLYASTHGRGAYALGF
jgi:hypothetical protein